MLVLIYMVIKKMNDVCSADVLTIVIDFEDPLSLWPKSKNKT